MGIFSFLKKNRQQEQPNREPVKQEQKQQETVKIPAMIDGQKIAYQYSKVDVVLADGVNLDGIFAQRVQFDVSRSPVALAVNGQYFGTIGNGKLSDMVSDWFRRGEPVFAVVSQIDDERYSATIDLYLYRDELKYLLRRYPEVKAYKLTGNRRGELQDNISYCERGDECALDYNFDKEKYLVSAGASDIGYLSAAAAKTVEECGEDNVSVYVAAVSSDDEGTDEVSVYIFPKRN